MLNKARVGNIDDDDNDDDDDDDDDDDNDDDDDVKNLFKARFVSESDENYPKYSFHIYVENEPAMKRNEPVLNELPGEHYTIEPKDKVPDNFKYPLVLKQAAQNQKQSYQS